MTCVLLLSTPLKAELNTLGGRGKKKWSRVETREEEAEAAAAAARARSLAGSGEETVCNLCQIAAAAKKGAAVSAWMGAQGAPPAAPFNPP